MPITVTCPGCSTKLNAPDSAAGKKVKCPKPGCGTIIPVPVPVAELEPLPLEPEFDEPVNAPPPKPKTKPARAVFDPEDELPRMKPRRRDDDYDDDDESDRQRRKQRRKSGGGLSPAVIAAIAVGGVLVLGGIGYGIYALVSKKDDTASSSGGGGGGGGGGSSKKAAVPDGWVEFKSDKDKFKAYFPKKPVYQNPGIAIYEGEDKEKDISSTVMMQDLPPNVPPEQIPQIKKSKLNLMIGVIPGAKKLSERETTLAGQPANEVVIEVTPPVFGKKGGNGEKGQGVLRVITANGKLYLVGIAKDKGVPTPDEVSGFFDNFELLK